MILALTDSLMAAILSPVAHIGGLGLASWNLRRVNAASCGFFMRVALPSRYDRVSEAAARLASPKTGTPTLLILSPTIGVVCDRFKTCFLGSQS